MDTLIDHAHMGIKTCLENDQNGSGCIPGPWMSNVLIKMGSAYNKEHKTYHMHHQIEIKTVRGKTGFLKFIWKLVLEIIWKFEF